MAASLKFVMSVMVLFCLSLVVAVAQQANAPHYVMTNDDGCGVLCFQPPNGVTFYTVGGNGLLTLKQQVSLSATGIGGGYFGMNRLAVVNSGGQQCVYASEAADGVIEGVNISTLTLGGTASGSSGDAGTSNGIGLVTNGQYLYASFTDSNTIGTFQVQPGCSLTFVNDVPVGGLQDGVIDAMAVHGNILVVTYGDGSIESFNISAGTPQSNGDKQNSTAAITDQDATFPSAVDITQDGHFAIFGDTSTSDVIEVSDISSGMLMKTVAYRSVVGISFSNIMLSPDESLLYVINTQGDQVSAAFFNKNDGTFSRGCASGLLKNYVSGWSYLSGMAMATNTGNGGAIYVAEFGNPGSIAMVKVTSSGATCTLAEAPGSPISDPNSPGLLSVSGFPPRSF